MMESLPVQVLPVSELPITRPAAEDILQMMLQDKRSEATRAAYSYDINKFFGAIANRPASPNLINKFFNLERVEAMSLVLRYKSDLLRDGLSEASVNRRLSAIKSLVRFGRRLDRCGWSLDDVSLEKIKPYRDVTGVDDDGVRALLKTPKRNTLKGKRDLALLILLAENALRRAEVTRCNKSDFSPEDATLRIYSKGHGSQQVIISLSDRAVEALNEWLSARGEDDEPALFVTLNNATTGRLSGAGLYYIIQQAGKAAGITKKLSPHRLRHSSITSALNHTGGDVRRVQKLSRHSKIETLMLYDDSRVDYQLEVSNILSAVFA